MGNLSGTVCYGCAGKAATVKYGLTVRGLPQFAIAPKSDPRTERDLEGSWMWN